MRMVNLARKDLVQIARDRKSFFFLVLMPIVFTLVFGLAFRSSGEAPRLPVGWVNNDRTGTLSAALHEYIEATGAIRLQEQKAKGLILVDADGGRGRCMGVEKVGGAWLDARSALWRSGRFLLFFFMCC